MKKIMKRIFAVTGLVWSVIYDKKNLSSNIYFGRRWDAPLSFSIGK